MAVTIKHTDAVASVLLLALAAGVYVIASSYPSGPTADPGSGFFPQVIAVAIAALAIIQLGQSVNDDEADTYLVGREQVVRVAIPFGMTVLYVGLMPVFGFLVGTILFLVAMIWYSGGRSFRVTVPVAVVVAIALYYVFSDFLHVPLPVSVVLPVSRLLPDVTGVI